jgi:lipopolysaccharide transport system ATP-binding protein
MSNVVIKVEDLSKQYRLGEIGTGTLNDDLNRWWHRIRGKEDPYLKIGETNDRTKGGESQYVWSLRDINFQVEAGEAVGFIGRNGAGKSTLLKVLSRVTAPTTGSVKIKGRVASLLEVGTGFHPDLSGRENVYLNGAILGMRKEEVKRKFDEIVDFAGVERYIDTPVKRYSSGMYVRLAFGVAAHLESEILIVDEVLAVGDAEFQKKCLGKMGQVSKGEGRTVLFVSHSMPSIKNLCNKCVLLKHGSVVMQGPTTDVVDFYNANFVEFKPESSVPVTKVHRKWENSMDIEYVNVAFKHPEPNNYFATADDIVLVLTVKASKTVNNFRISFGITTIDETPVGVYFSKEFLNIQKDETKNVEVSIKNHQLAKGQYVMSFSVGIGNEVSGFRDYDVIEQVLFFEIVYKDKEHKEMISLWESQWGTTNFQSIEVKEI